MNWSFFAAINLRFGAINTYSSKIFLAAITTSAKISIDYVKNLHLTAKVQIPLHINYLIKHLNNCSNGNSFIRVYGFARRFAKQFLDCLLNFGIRIIPQTNKTSPISDDLTSASCIAFLQGSIARQIYSHLKKIYSHLIRQIYNHLKKDGIILNSTLG